MSGTKSNRDTDKDIDVVNQDEKKENSKEGCPDCGDVCGYGKKNCPLLRKNDTKGGGGDGGGG